MAFDIFTGSNIKVELATAAPTREESTDFVVVPEIASYPAAAGGESTVIDVVTFGSVYNRKLIGTRSITDVEINVNWLPDDVTHMQLAKAAEDQTRVQIRFSYYENASQTTGVCVVLNGFVSNDSVTSDKDAVTVRNFVLSVDGAPISTYNLPKVP
ncbi:hypothetical protein ACX1IQ_21080 [Yersinia enterocolitica]|nr:hypothetical protein [Yersinia enterocolitica]